MSRSEAKSDVDLWFYFGFRLFQIFVMATLAIASFGRRFEDALIMAGVAAVILGQYCRKWEDSL